MSFLFVFVLLFFFYSKKKKKKPVLACVILLRFHARIWIRSTIQMSSYYQSFLPPPSSTDPVLVFVIVDLQQQHQHWPSHAGTPTNCARSDHHLICALHLTADLLHQAPL
jgi:hypothetical protein